VHVSIAGPARIAQLTSPPAENAILWRVITYDQFKVVLADRAARERLGFALSDDEVQSLLSNEAQAIVYFEEWNRSASHVRSVAPHVPGVAIAGFCFALVGILAGASGTIGQLIGVVLGIVGLFLSIAGIRAGSKRFAAAGVALAGIAIIGCVMVIVDRSIA
jgi:hypothetical protein